MPADSSNGVDQASDFFDFVTTMYPNTSDHWQMFSTEQEFEDLIRDANYSRAIGEAYVLPAISAGIVFASGSPDWEYTVREYSGAGGSGGGGGGGGRHRAQSGCTAPSLVNV